MKKLTKYKKPVIRISKELDEYEGKILFPEKVKRANEMLKNAEHPEEFFKRLKQEKVNSRASQIDNSMKKYIGKVMTKEKMNEANERLKRTKLPEQYYTRKKS